jgi:hypothetical protein
LDMLTEIYKLLDQNLKKWVFFHILVLKTEIKYGNLKKNKGPSWKDVGRYSKSLWQG